MLRRFTAWLTGRALARLTRLLTAPQILQGGSTTHAQTIYVANHRSNADTVLIWSVMPARIRKHVRPVAAADYWHKSALRRFIGNDVFHILPIERRGDQRNQDPIEQMCEALNAGSSLILFPEGTRNTTDAPLLPLKSGIAYLAAARPDIAIVPIWIDNLSGVMPKGEILPVPLICTLQFGTPVHRWADESKADFLERLRQAMLDLAPAREASPSRAPQQSTLPISHTKDRQR